MTRIALITSVTGEDSASLAEFLRKQGYEGPGIKHRSSPTTPMAECIHNNLVIHTWQPVGLEFGRQLASAPAPPAH